MTDSRPGRAHRLVSEAVGVLRAVVGSGSADEVLSVLMVCEGFGRELDGLQTNSIDAAGSSDGGPDAPDAEPGSADAEPDPDVEPGE